MYCIIKKYNTAKIVLGVMCLKSKKMFIAQQFFGLGIIGLFLLAIYSTLDKSPISVSTSWILIISFIGGISAFLKEKKDVKEDLLLKEKGIMYECQKVEPKQHYGVKISGYYSFYILCEYLDSEGNVQIVKSRPYILRKGGTGIMFNDGKLNISCSAVVYVDKENKDKYFIDATATALR